MPKFHTVYITKLGVPFFEEAQEYDTEFDAASDAASTFLPTKDENGNYHESPVLMKTIEGRAVVLTDIDHIRIMTPEELADMQEQERRANLEARGIDPDTGLPFDPGHGPVAF